jgi:hypothetical protein
VWASLAVLGSAVAIVLSIAKWNGMEAAMPARMGSLKDVAAIVIITTDTRIVSTSVLMCLENCFVMIRALTSDRSACALEFSSYAIAT